MRSSLIHLVLAFVVCTAALAGYGVWYATVSAKSAAVTGLQDRIDAKTATVKRMTAAKAAFSGIEGDEAIVQSYFVPETGVVSFIDSLEGLGNSLGAAVSVLSVSAEETPSSSLTFLFSITGTFDAVLRTVGAIEYAPYAISLSSLSVGQDEGNVWHADLKLSVGSLPASAATTKP